MNSFEMAREFNRAFGRTICDSPREPTIEERILWAKLLLSETFETIQKGLGVELMFETMNGVEYYLDEDVINFVTEKKPYDPVETLDGIADVKVISNGMGACFGLPVEHADLEVFNSNMSKLDEDGTPIINSCRHWIDEDAESAASAIDETRAYCQHQLRGASSCPETNHLIDPTQPIGKVLKGPKFRKPNIAGLLEDFCADHFASSHDPKVCGGCGTHIDSMR